MIAIVDYGVGNLFSLKSSFAAIGHEATVSADTAVIRRADKLILPGVGAFRDAVRKLRESGLFPVVQEEAGRGKPLLGICLGMQMLFERSFEDGVHEGLSLLSGEVRSIAEAIPPDLKIPEIGWNSLHLKNNGKLFEGIEDGAFVYFVHSFYAEGCEDSLAAVTEYGISVTAAVEKGNIFGCQFHPEKSGPVGLQILKNFSEMEG